MTNSLTPTARDRENTQSKKQKFDRSFEAKSVPNEDRGWGEEDVAYR